jgi:SPP1 family predicted phage head-tail adaptor
MLQSKEQIGKMDKRITFQQKVDSEVDDSNATPEEGWEDVDESPNWWVAWNESPGNEIMQAEQLAGSQVIELIGRFRQVLLTWTVSYGGYRYDIISTQEIGRKRFLRILIRNGKPFVEA